MNSAQNLSVDIEKRIVCGNGIYFLANPNLIFFALVIFLLPHVDKIRELEADNEQKVVGV